MFLSRHGVPVDDHLAQLFRNHIAPNLDQTSEKQRAEANGLIKEVLLEISQHPKELQAGLIHLLENDGTDKTHHIFLIDAFMEETPLTVINEYITYQQHMGRGFNSLLLGSLRYYSQLPQLDDYSTVSDTVRKQISALFTITKKLVTESSNRRTVIQQSTRTYDPNFEHGLPWDTVTPPRIAHGLKRAHVIKGDDLVQFVMDNHGKANEIARIIIERNTGDADLIDSIVNSDSPAVSGGRL